MSPRTALCFGDSNTFGFDAENDDRFPPDVRWPGVLTAELGDGWRVIEEGLGGRTTVFDDPLLPHRNGRDYLVPCLASHAPLDVVVLFLGTNDLKARFGADAAQIAAGVGALARIALESGSSPEWSSPQVLVLGLPRLAPITAHAAEFHGAAEKAAALGPLVAAHAAELGVAFLDLAETVAFAAHDGFHLDTAGHAAVGALVAQTIRGMF